MKKIIWKAGFPACFVGFVFCYYQYNSAGIKKGINDPTFVCKRQYRQ